MAENMNKDGMQLKQKITIAAIVIIFIVIVWQLKAILFPATPTIEEVPAATQTTAATPKANSQQTSIKEAPLPAKDTMLSEGEKRLLALQMQTEAKYIAAMNELQLMRVQSEIARNSKDIAQNRLDAVTAQKQTLQLLSAPQATAANYAQGLSTEGSSPPSQSIATQAPQAEYIVVSVSQLQNRWAAVLGYQGQLYNVSVGDILTPDGAKVIGIDRYGVTLDRNGNKQRVSLVSLV